MENDADTIIYDPNENETNESNTGQQVNTNENTQNEQNVEHKTNEKKDACHSVNKIIKQRKAGQRKQFFF